MRNMVVCSSLAMGAAQGGRRALNWIHPTWSACAELHNVRERDLTMCGNKSNKQTLLSPSEPRKEERKEKRKQGKAPALGHIASAWTDAMAAEKRVGRHRQKGRWEFGGVPACGCASSCVLGNASSCHGSLQADGILLTASAGDHQ